jgi:hypothetical protein
MPRASVVLGRLMPVPVNAPVTGEAFAASEAIVRVSVSGPVAMGEKVPEMAQTAPEVSEVPAAQVFDPAMPTVKSAVSPEAV